MRLVIIDGPEARDQVGARQAGSVQETDVRPLSSPFSLQQPERQTKSEHAWLNRTS